MCVMLVPNTLELFLVDSTHRIAWKYDIHGPIHSSTIFSSLDAHVSEKYNERSVRPYLLCSHDSLNLSSDLDLGDDSLNHCSPL